MHRERYRHKQYYLFIFSLCFCSTFIHNVSWARELFSVLFMMHIYIKRWQDQKKWERSSQISLRVMLDVGVTFQYLSEIVSLFVSSSFCFLFFSLTIFQTQEKRLLVVKCRRCLRQHYWLRSFQSVEVSYVSSLKRRKGTFFEKFTVLTNKIVREEAQR